MCYFIFMVSRQSPESKFIKMMTCCLLSLDLKSNSSHQDYMLGHWFPFLGQQWSGHCHPTELPWYHVILLHSSLLRHHSFGQQRDIQSWRTLLFSFALVGYCCRNHQQHLEQAVNLCKQINHLVLLLHTIITFLDALEYLLISGGGWHPLPFLWLC